MKIVFVFIGAESLAVEYLSAALRSAGHRTALVFDPALFDDKRYLTARPLAGFFSQGEAVVGRIISESPDLVAFSVLTNNFQWALNLARRVRERIASPIIFGGVHPSLLPERVLRHGCVDFACRGDGEETIVEAAECLRAGHDLSGIAGLCARGADGAVRCNPLRPILAQLDSLPFPDKDLFAPHMDIRENYLLLGSRGCPYRCSYCNSPNLAKLQGAPRLRYRSPENIVAELLQARRRYAIRNVEFADDIFTLNRRHLDALLRLYEQEIRLPFRCLSHPLHIDGPMTSALRRAGCYKVQIGVQSMDAGIRRDVLLRPETNADIERALSACEKAGLPYQIDHIFAIPGEGAAHYAAAARTYVEHDPVRIASYRMSYFPETPMLEFARATGAVSETKLEDAVDGRAGIYHLGGSVTNSVLEPVYRAWEALFTLLPLLPRGVGRWLAQPSKARWLRHLPTPLLVLMDLTNFIRTRDASTDTYLRYYAHQCARVLAQRAPGALAAPWRMIERFLAPRMPLDSERPEPAPRRGPHIKRT